mmetsp:Transcript_68038/g.168083  ORF Transcript_68038/g.168083 Transcript_68038/m.168083 type:complete len:210 (-) Transcript_68038:312-941(-)
MSAEHHTGVRPRPQHSAPTTHRPIMSLTTPQSSTEANHCTHGRLHACLLLGRGLGGREDILELLLELRVGALEELHLLRVLLLVKLAALALALLDGFALGLEVLDLPLQVLLVRLQLHNLVLHVRLPLLRLQRLAHPKRHAALIQGLVCSDGHPDLIPHAQQQKPPLSTVDRDLPDQLVKRLAIELLTHGADPRLPRLPLLQLPVEVLL